MAIRKIVRKSGKVSWLVDWREPSAIGKPGRRRKKCFDRKVDAQAYYGAVLRAKRERRYHDIFKVKPETSMTFSELADLYEENHKDQRGWYSSKKHVLEMLREEFGDRSLSELRYFDLERFRNKRLKTPTVRKGSDKRPKPRTRTCVNREMGVFRHVLNKAVEWGFLEKSPFTQGKSLFFRENATRIRYLDKDQISKLLAECPEPLYSIVLTAILTGMRRGELLGLKWDQIKGNRICLTETKTDRERQIPMNGVVRKVFKHQRAENGLKSDYVFCQDGGKPITPTILRTAFRNALKRAKIKNICFHDLRHTFASHIVMNNRGLKVVQELLGHTNIKTTMRYAHLSPEHHQAAVDSLESVTADVPPPRDESKQVVRMPAVKHSVPKNSLVEIER